MYPVTQYSAVFQLNGQKPVIMQKPGVWHLPRLSVMPSFSKTTHHVFDNKVIKINMRSFNGNLQHLQCILQSSEIILIFSIR